jgi:hypothetical protein
MRHRHMDRSRRPRGRGPDRAGHEDRRLF